MMREISLLKSVEEIYTMCDIIWVFHVSDGAFISRHASFPMTKTGNKKKNGSKKKPVAKRSEPTTRIPNCQGIVLLLLLFPISHVQALSMKLTTFANMK